jgi:hypothetical protein
MRGVGRLLYLLRHLATCPIRKRPAEAAIVFGAPHGVVETAFKCTLAQERSWIVPKRFRKGVAYVSARKADIREHAAIEASQQFGLAAVSARPHQFFEPMRHQSQQRGECP